VPGAGCASAPTPLERPPRGTIRQQIAAHRGQLARRRRALLAGRIASSAGIRSAPSDSSNRCVGGRRLPARAPPGARPHGVRPSWISRLTKLWRVGHRPIDPPTPVLVVAQRPEPAVVAREDRRGGEHPALREPPIRQGPAPPGRGASRAARGASWHCSARSRGCARARPAGRAFALPRVAGRRSPGPRRASHRAARGRSRTAST